jgi:hypothetical protein
MPPRIHAVHQVGESDRVVLTTFVELGTYDNHAWSTLLDSLPGNRLDVIPIGDVNLNALLSLPAASAERMYDYAGSLTTPPCTPNVRFLHPPDTHKAFPGPGRCPRDGHGPQRPPPADQHPGRGGSASGRTLTQ